eukprot:TRINITY_DN1533_c0_g1_i5.p1 TRINITY_DN1533_c0_g1~~TRINITY_DN1533_c0_g1_i5.p1  ORF type:complete len:295 (+),score=52.72 TRINITY_DN1533_c0_g1_i5:1-885(+)
MIPGNWPVNAADMDVLFPREGQHYEQIAVAMGKDFFQTPEYGWKSVAAWFKRTNVVIPGCGLDLFDQDFEEQTRCILSRVVSRQEAFDIVGSCLPDAVGTTTAPVATTSSVAISPAPTPLPTMTTMPPATPSPTVLPTPAMTETTSAAPTTSLSTTSAASSTSSSEGVSCRAASGGADFGATDERCQVVCEVVQLGSWPCGDGHPCVCGTATSSTTPMMPSTSSTQTVPSTTPRSSTTSSLRGTTSTTPAETMPCVANPAVNRGVSNSNCARCPLGYQWWPCNEAILCIGDCSP